MNRVQQVLSAAVIAALPLSMALAQTPAPASKPTRPAAVNERVTAERAAERARAFVAVQGGSYLGVHTRDVNSERAAALRLPEERGAEITGVDKDAPAGKAGLRENDVVLEFNGQRVESQEQLRRMIRETPSGRTVTLGIIRDGSPQNVQVELAARPGTRVIMPKPGEAPHVQAFSFGSGHPSVTVLGGTPILGTVVDSLTPQLAEYFGVKNGEGMLIRSVEKNTPAEAAGLRAGDVIVRIGEHRVADRSDLRRALRDHSGATQVVVIREKREMTFTVTLPAPRERGSNDVLFEIPDLPNIELDLNVLGESLRTLEPEMRRLHEEMIRLKPRIEEELKQLERVLKVDVQKRLEESQRVLEESIRIQQRI